MAKDISEQLRDAIEADERSLFQFARDCGVDYSPLYKFLKGQRDLRLETAARIALALNLELRSTGR